ncbi:tetratricopeptide repeat protein (plasmid) [Nostoc sp. UHCC 0302]|uniref:protein kinase domain-containing protein n=1 Tax=Nostoc sp. UHCC 0302 TaxID=3134896 RepID=UPI00311CB6C4
MVYCINPFCSQRENPEDAVHCLACGNPLLINGHIRLLRPLRSLTEDPYTYTDIFEVEDTGTSLHPETQRRVMKILKWINEPKLVELLRRESIILQTLDHPGIPKSNREDYFTFALNGNLLVMHCLVMQKFEGEDLKQWIKKYGRISQNIALDWLLQLVNILDLVHRNEYFHRDIKPDNIIHQPDGKIALIDFGGAREISRTFLAKLSTNGGTSTGSSMGYEITAVRSAYYSPLEQIHGQAVPQSDFYALGRTFVHLVTGISLANIKSDEKTGKLLWRDKAPHIDKFFADLIDDLIAPFPGQRPQNTQIILQRLRKIPYQSKIYKLINYRAFLFSASILLIAIGFVVNCKIALPLLVNSLIAQGEKSEAANDSQSAQKFFDSAIKFNPQVKANISKFYFDKASRSTKNVREGKKYFELSLKYNNQDVDNYNNLAFACQLLNEFECASTNYKKALELKPDNWEGHYGLGTFYDDQGKKDLAEQQYELAIKNNNQAIPVINNLSRLKVLKGDYNAAIALALQGLQKTKEAKLQAALYKNLGWAKFEQKKYTEAKEYLEKAEELDAQRADTHCLLAQVQEALGDNDNSWLSWEACLLLEAKQPEVFLWRGNVLQRIRLKPDSQQ